MTHFSDVRQPKFQGKQSSCFNIVINYISCLNKIFKFPSLPQLLLCDLMKMLQQTLSNKVASGRLVV